YVIGLACLDLQDGEIAKHLMQIEIIRRLALAMIFMDESQNLRSIGRVDSSDVRGHRIACRSVWNIDRLRCCARANECGHYRHYGLHPTFPRKQSACPHPKSWLKMEAEGNHRWSIGFHQLGDARPLCSLEEFDRPKND